MTPTIVPAPVRRSRKRVVAPATGTPPASLTLIAARYVDNAFLDLTFDHAIDVGAFNGDGVFVDDAVDALLTFIAIGGAELLSATIVRIELVEFENATGTGVTLTAPGNTGIVASNGGAAWAGCTALALPFG